MKKKFLEFKKYNRGKLSLVQINGRIVTQEFKASKITINELLE